MRFALFKEVPKRQRRKKRKLNSGAARNGDKSDESNDESDDEGPERMNMPPSATPVGAAVKTRSKSVPVNQQPQDPIWGDESQDTQMEVEQPPAVGPTDDDKIRPER